MGGNTLTDYQKGYNACMQEVETFLKNSIERNKGAQTFADMAKVLNDFIYFLHYHHLEQTVTERPVVQPLVMIIGGKM